MKHGSMYGHKGMSGAYKKSMSYGSMPKAMHGKNPFKSKSMTRAKEVKPSHKGYAM